MFRFIAFLVLTLMLSHSSYATILPGPADSSRIKIDEHHDQGEQKPQPTIAIPAEKVHTSAPKDARNIHFVLHDIRITGSTLPPDELRPFYSQYLGRKISADKIWIIADDITNYYHSQGYFISKAIVPNQAIQNGNITIHVIEGYIAQVKTEEANSYLLNMYIDELTKLKPISTSKLESFLLSINDIYGKTYKGVLSKIETRSHPEGSVQLNLVSANAKDELGVSLDNNQSKYLGPHEIIATYTTSLYQAHKTTASGVVSVPFKRLKYGTLEHSVAALPRLFLDFNAGLVGSHPGYTLKPLNVEGETAFGGVGLRYNLIRQRDINAYIKLVFDIRDTHTHILQEKINEDNIRVLRLSTGIDYSDSLDGFNNINVIASKGLDIMGASKKDSPFISRAHATPTFSKIEATLSRLQKLNNTFSLFLASNSQYAFNTMHAPEEYTYGGSYIGRAYDIAEISGDHGISGLAELRLTPQTLSSIKLAPYAFYDAGFVWKKDHENAKDRFTGQSAGLGVRVNITTNINGNIALAFPMTREISVPIYKWNRYAPRLLFNIGITY